MNRKNVWILLAALVLLAVVLTTPLSNIAHLGSSYLNPPTSDTKLDVDEINAFLAVWSEFAQKDIGRSMRQVSLSQDSAVPAQVSRWLKAKGWNAERFFAVEQHLRELVAVADLQNSIEGNKQLYQKGAADLQAIIKNQEQQLKALHYNPQELALVRANIYQISNILDGKAVLE